jgi:hypothetical protein
MRLAVHWFRKKTAARFIVLSAIAVPFHLTAQVNPASQTASVPIPPPPIPAFQRPVSWKSLLVNVAENQKRICIFPARLNKKTSWIPSDAIRQGTAVSGVGIPATIPKAFVGCSGITFSAHFISDVFMGGSLAYSLSRFAALRQ